MMNRRTAKNHSVEADIKQSIDDILSTPLGSRLMRPLYGALLFKLVDAPAHDATLLRYRVAVLDALQRWEPRVDVSDVGLKVTMNGIVVLEIAYAVLGTNTTDHHSYEVRL